MAHYDLSIDLQLNKLVVWAVDRGLAPADFKKREQSVLVQLGQLMAELPKGDGFQSIHSAPYVTYFHVLKTIDLAAKSDLPRDFVDAWRTLAREYERDGLMYATCGEVLATLALEDIPELRRRLGRAQKAVMDLDKKKGEVTANVASYSHKYAAQCRELGIAGNNPAVELRALAHHARDVYRDVMVRVQDDAIAQAMDFYVQFSAFTTAAGAARDVGDVFSTLTRLRSAPLENAGLHLKSGLEPEAALKIEVVASEDVSQAVPVDGGAGDGGGIDWGEEEIADGDWQGLGERPANVAAGNLELGDAKVRSALLDELLQLDGFFEQRLAEIGDMSTDMSLDLLQNAPPAVRDARPSTLQTLHKAVTRPVAALTAPRAQALILMAASDAYLESVAEMLNNSSRWVDQLLAHAGDIDCQAAANRGVAAQLPRKIALYTAEARDIQRQLEAAISKRYNGREVRIVGSINAL